MKNGLRSLCGLSRRWLLGAMVCVTLGGLPSSAEALEIIIGMPYGRHTIGHTAVRIRTFDKDKEVIFDFGRYGRTWGYLRFHGEGVMRVWRGTKAIRSYIRRQRSIRDSWGFVIKTTPAEEKKILAHYEKKLRKTKWRRKYRSHIRVRLADDYHGVFRQCTSMALEGLKAVWPRRRWETILNPTFNLGQGFTRRMHRYFYKNQKKKGINEVVVPLDVLASFQHALAQKTSWIKKVRRYPRRRKSRLKYWWALARKRGKRALTKKQRRRRKP